MRMSFFSWRANVYMAHHGCSAAVFVSRSWLDINVGFFGQYGHQGTSMAYLRDGCFVGLFCLARGRRLGEPANPARLKALGMTNP